MKRLGRIFDITIEIMGLVFAVIAILGALTGLVFLVGWALQGVIR